MTTREEFERLVRKVIYDPYMGKKEMRRAADAIIAAWDAQAAEVERLRAEVEAERDALRTGVPLTAENAPRARVVEDADGNIWHATMPWWRGLSGAKCHTRDFLRVVVGDRGATVLAWRK